MIVTDRNFSDIIQSFISNEIKAILNKYTNMDLEKIQKVEALISKINDEEFKKELLLDFDKTLKLSTEIGDKYVDYFTIKMYLWIKSNTDLDLNMDAVDRVIQEVEENGYCEINDNTMIYIEGTNLKDIAVEKLETMLEDSYFVDKLLDKDSLIEYFINGTSKDQVIRELVNGIEIEELLDMNIQNIFENNYNQHYMYAQLDC
ncbi:MAG: hypothetical protein KIC47_07180 [Clostridium sp.]|uniref:hypothetical protein n=1 Tax=Clostridium neonatale TaxID=137838 RepID=UPI001D48F6EF|nr:hypothetical protein [Clostridium neonatale]MBS5950089.1 hypothetical protein [Clostridium sp.]CAI3607487.1 conserved hypothetical protein [Clostridium neonatale]CAI3632473.1 conserved hypothetical protein [Clostridium neonatale]